MLSKWCVVNVALVLALTGAAGCKRKSPPPPAPANVQSQTALPAQALAAGAPAAAKSTELTPEMRSALASAALAPADAAFFQNAQHLGKFWSDILQSRSVQNVVQLPMVQSLWLQAKTGNPVVAGILRAIENEPAIVEGIPVLKDALAGDVFVCGSPETVPFIKAVQALMGEVNALQMKTAIGSMEHHAAVAPGVSADRPPAAETGIDGNALADALLKNRESLRLPGMLMGFRLANKSAAQTYLDKWVPQIETGELAPIRKVTVAGAPFYSFELKGDRVPAKDLQELQTALAKAKISESKASELIAWFKDQRVVVAVGIVGDYLMISLGSDTAFVERWGKGPSVAELPALDPIRRRLDRKPFAVTYLSSALAGCFIRSREDYLNIVTMYTNIIPPDAPLGLKERIRKDASQLIAETVPTAAPSAHVSISFINKGIETFEFCEGACGLDCSEPLNILRHRGAPEIAAYATHAKPAREVYPLLVKYARIAYSYFQDYALPKMEPKERADFEKAMTLVLPCLASFDETTRTSLLPSIDGAQSLIVLDGRGQLSNAPDGQPLPVPFPIPRLGIAIQLADALAFQKAIREYAAAARALLEGIKREFPEAPRELALPPPETRAAAGGTLYLYSLPWPLGNDVVPCALLKDRLLVLASSTGLAEEMTAESAMPASNVVDFAQPAGSAFLFQWTELWDYTQRAANAVLLYQAVPNGNPQTMLIQMHLQALLRSLSAIKGYSSITTVEGGWIVTHSWLRVEENGT